MIETAGLWKRYDDVEALRGLDVQVPRGSIFSFLGRNGAGWRPLLIRIGIACAMVFASFVARQLAIFSVMNGESYFRYGVCRGRDS